MLADSQQIRGNQMSVKKARRSLVAGIFMGALVALGINAGVGFLTTHHQVEYNCHQADVGWECDTKWVHN